MLIKHFEEQVKRQPDKIAIKHGEESISYDALNRSANRIAAFMKTKTRQLCKEKQVGLLLEHGSDMIVSILAVMKAGLIYVPLCTDYPDSRLSYMIDHSQISLIVSNAESKKKAEKLASGNNVAYIEIEKIARSCSGENPARDSSGEKPVYIMYTSGSTGKPKGVVQNQRNVLYYIENWTKKFSITAADRMTLFSSFSHDGSLQDMFGALLKGASLYPYDLKNQAKSIEIGEFLIKERITIWHSIPSLFNAFAVTQSGQETFPDLRYILLGGEPLRQHEIDISRKIFPGSTLANVYGQTESSVSSIWIIDKKPLNDRIVIGEPLDHTALYVVDEDGNEVYPLEIGEIVVAGPHLSSGYWRDREETDRFFCEDADYGMLYRSGDLGRLLLDGGIEFIGRKDSQVKIRGYRVEPGEIESHLLKYDGIKEAVVLAEDRRIPVKNCNGIQEDLNDEKYLCAYITTENKLDVTNLKNYLSVNLPDYMVPFTFVQLEKMPLTISGKIDRNALPAPRCEVKEKYVAPAGEAEEKLVEIWVNVLGIEKEIIGVNSNFFELGGHSLKATVLLSRIHKEFKVKVPFTVLFKMPTIRGLSRYITETCRDTYTSLEPVEKKEYYPLSSAQRRIYILQQSDPGSIAYNMPYSISVDGDTNIERLKALLLKIISRHEILRTSFETIAGEPVQRIHDQVEFAIDYYDLYTYRPTATEKIKAITKNFIRSFKLSEAPLLHVGLIETAERGKILLLDLHHILTDGSSREILAQEFALLCETKELTVQKLQYKDYVAWQGGTEQQLLMKQQENYWIRSFPDEFPVMNLPTDYPRPLVKDFAGDTINFRLPEEETRALREFVLKNEVTLFMLLSAVFFVLLAKLSSQEDVIVGIPIAGRRNSDIENIVGMFVNTIALRSYPQGDKTFRRFLEEIKQGTLEAYENQEYFFENLVDRLSIPRDPGRNPLFDTMFNLVNREGNIRDFPKESDDSNDYEPKISKFDLSLIVIDSGEGIWCHFEYASGLFKAGTIRGIIGYFKQILATLPINLEKKLAEIEIISSEEREQVLYNFNRTDSDYPKTKSIYRHFEESVRKNQGHTAIVYEDMNVTYGALSGKAGQLAKTIRTAGINPGSIVGILSDRSPELLSGILGILKAGAAYLPIDPKTPTGRVHYFIRDSGITFILTKKKYMARVGHMCNVIDIEEPYLHKDGFWELNDGTAAASSPAYVLYTSGSSGLPKGVLIENLAVVNFLYSIYTNFSKEFAPGDRSLCLTNITFDVSVCEIFLPLFFGSSCILLPDEILFDSKTLAEVIVKNAVTFAYIPPGFLTFIYNHLKNNGSTTLKKLLIGVEPIRDFVIEDYFKLNPSMQVLNGYGPTETTICSTMYRCFSHEPTGKNIPIGKPLCNTRVLLLDAGARLTPLGVAGEICISGAGLARGYLNNPELSKSKFIANDFFNNERMYKTGDLGKWSSNGEIEFSGRIDTQVKIRGFRIELGEIESRLLKHKNIDAAVVLAKKDSSGDKYLCAYLAARNGIPSTDSLRDFLSHTIPTYMIPAHFVYLDRIPLTANGKINHKALPDPVILPGSKYVAPADEIEWKLVDLWAELLEVEKEKIGVNDNFFDLGGNSLKVTQLSGKIKDTFGVDVPVPEMYKHPDINSLARVLNRGETGINSSTQSTERAISLDRVKSSRISQREKRKMDRNA